MRADWLSALSPEWETVPFGSLFTQSKRKNDDLQREFVLSVVKGRGVIPYTEKGNVGNKVSDDLSKYKLVDPGDFVLNSMNLYMGSVGVSDYEGVTSTAYIVCKPRPGVETAFYRHLIQCRGFQEFVGLLGKGIMEIREAVRWTALKSVPVPLPDGATQKAIADFLDRETARIDQLIEKKQRLVALLDERLENELTAAVLQTPELSGELTESGHDWLGCIPSSWPLSRIGWELERITYGFTNPMPTEDEGPYLLTANDINFGEVQWATARRTSEAAFRNDLTDKSRPQRGDVLITKDGTLGRVAIHDGRLACINQSVALLRPNARKIDSRFLSAVLQTAPYQERMAFEAGGTTIKHIYISRLSKMPLPVPSLDVQKRIAASVSHVGTTAKQIARKISGSIERLRELRAALITTAVTGQIDVNTWGRQGQIDRRLDRIDREMPSGEVGV